MDTRRPFIAGKVDMLGTQCGLQVQITDGSCDVRRTRMRDLIVIAADRVDTFDAKAVDQAPEGLDVFMPMYIRLQTLKQQQFGLRAACLPGRVRRSLAGAAPRPAPHGWW